AYTGGWKKAEPVWDWIVRGGLLPRFLPVLETVLSGGQFSSGVHFWSDAVAPKMNPR
ncbi:MAG: hypothetical protein IH586_10785, partial [Anaerolineaceae bacterium]|nr:hypothetical protein [Anaerolineaceae bacterium]